MEHIAAAYVLSPGQERSHSGTTPTIKAGAADTGGAMTAVAGVLGPWASGPPLHSHDTVDESFYVVEGRLLLQIGKEQRVLEAGSFAWIPRGTPHTFANAGPAEVRMFGVSVPGGSEEHLAAQCAYLASVQGPPDLAELGRLAAGWGNLLGPPISAKPAPSDARPLTGITSSSSAE